MSDALPVKGRHLLMIATGDYTDSVVWPELEVEKETGVWSEWLTDPTLGDRAFTLAWEDLAHSPTLERVEEVLRQRDTFDKERDVVVCYITGHGERFDGAHHLVVSDSWPGEPDTWLETHRVLKWLKTRVNTALIVVDTCYAGDVGAYLAGLDQDLPAGWIVIASASSHEQARLGKMTRALEDFSRSGQDDPASEYLDYYELLPALADALQGQRWQPFGTLPPRSRSRLASLPNRHYQSDVDERVLVEPARQGVAMYEKDLAAHWDPRSRGVADASAPGVLFTGRDRLMEILVDAARCEPGVLVVTGSSGCGKSAVLSRLVTFSDPRFRARHADAVDAATARGGPLPAEGDVDVAVLAKGLVAQGVLDAIRDRLGIDPVDAETSAETVARIHQQRAGKLAVTLVVDALEEAEDPRGILNTVLTPLINPPGGTPWLRLLVGVRGAAPTIGAAAEEGDSLAAATVRALRADIVDAAGQLWSSADLAAYVAVLLRLPLDGEQPSPYADTGDYQVDRLADTVAEIAEPSYALARLISDQLRRQPHPQDPDDMAWQARARAGMATVLDEELEADYPDPDRRARVRSLLTAASLGRGLGVPRRRIWPAIAAALHATALHATADADVETFDDDDIAALLEQHVGGYLTRDVDDNATVYRPFHDSLAQALTEQLEPTTLHAVTTALTGLFASTDIHGLLVPPQEYLLRHLVEHAAASGDLNQIVNNPTVLTWTNPDHLLPLLDQLSDPEAREIGRIYRTVANTLRRTDCPPDTFPLQLRARQAGLDTLADQFADQPTDTSNRPPGRLRWATPRHDSEHHRIDTSAASIAVAALPDGTPVIVSGSQDDTVRVWRLADGASVGGPLLQPGGVSSVVAGALPDGTPVIVSGGVCGTVLAWRLSDGAPVGGTLLTNPAGVNSVAVGALVDGTPVIVSGNSNDGAVQVWRLVDGTSVGEPIRGHKKGVNSVAVGALSDGTPVIIGGVNSGAGATVRVWRLADGAPVGRALTYRVFTSVFAVAVGALPDGTPVIVSGSADRTVRVWRLSDGAPVGKPIRSHTGVVFSVAVGALPDGTPVIVSGCSDGEVRVSRLIDGAPVGKPLRGHDGAVLSVAVGALRDGTPVVVSSSRDETVRIWQLRDGIPVGEPRPGHMGRVMAVAAGALPDGTQVVVSGGRDGTVRVWRLADGAPIGEPIRGHDGWVTSVAAGRLSDGTPVIVSGGRDGTVRVWRLADGAALGKPLRGHKSVVCAVAAGRLPDGKSIIVSGSGDGTVRVWRPADSRNRRWSRRTRLHVSELPLNRRAAVLSVAVGALPDGTPVIVSIDNDKLLRGWRHSTPVGEPILSYECRGLSLEVGALPDGTLVILNSGADGGSIVRLLADGSPVGEPMRGPSGGVGSLAVGALPDGAPIMVSGGSDGRVRVWRLRDGTLVGIPLFVLSFPQAIIVTGKMVVAAVGGDLIAIELNGT